MTTNDLSARLAALSAKLGPRTAESREVGSCGRCGDPVEARAARCWGCGKEAN